MARESSKQLPREVLKHLEELGQHVRTARVRRRMSTEDLAQACDIGRRSLYRLENGEPGIALGTFMSVLWKLGLLDTIRGVANPDTDEHGKILEAASRPQRVRAPASDNDF
ncbi:helix-turn-helix domain-containing protein [Variovorax sp. LjRoot84]|uniref:helix-turn-helix domain-containing protein n=1 Tax=Variovorax sp. LjRoot84 TaxID=3342340 RepID=UPI003F51286A